ncbi:uncharacterized protein LOC131649111 [Vicia villosa]|uniref:uncharacterized protein LOC131649111 n=1 Tax=Vicia villosa TaxID=3911 RepID=UPI00273B74E0|nr:uncharacterized protein LOC131649111 [Vicia villosa]
MIYIDELSFFMHKHIENIVDVGTDANCGYRAVVDLLRKREENHTLIRQTLISELTSHMDLYTRTYENKEKFDKIHDALVPSLTSHAPVSKWMSYPKMGHLIASAYDRVCVDLTKFGFSETFFPLHSRPPLDASSHIICIGYLRSRHFVQVFLKPECPIPTTSCEWMTHHTKEADTWPDLFSKRMVELKEIMKQEMEENREKSKNLPILELSGEGSFGAF